MTVTEEQKKTNIFIIIVHVNSSTLLYFFNPSDERSLLGTGKKIPRGDAWARPDATPAGNDIECQTLDQKAGIIPVRRRGYVSDAAALLLDTNFLPRLEKTNTVEDEKDRAGDGRVMSRPHPHLPQTKVANLGEKRGEFLH